jgi:hypothetical protein
VRSGLNTDRFIVIRTGVRLFVLLLLLVMSGQVVAQTIQGVAVAPNSADTTHCRPPGNSGQAWFLHNYNSFEVAATVEVRSQRAGPTAITTFTRKLKPKEDYFLGCSADHSSTSFTQYNSWSLKSVAGATGSSSSGSGSTAPTPRQDQALSDNQRLEQLFASRDCDAILDFVYESGLTKIVNRSLVLAIKHNNGCVYDGLANHYHWTSQALEALNFDPSSHRSQKITQQWVDRMIDLGARPTRWLAKLDDQCGQRNMDDVLEHLVTKGANLDWIEHPSAQRINTARWTILRACPGQKTWIDKLPKDERTPIEITLFDGEFHDGTRVCREYDIELVCSDPATNPHIVKKFILPPRKKAGANWTVVVQAAIAKPNRPVTVNINGGWVKQGVLNGMSTGGWGPQHLDFFNAGTISDLQLGAANPDNTVVVSTNGVLPHLRAIWLFPQ